METHFFSLLRENLKESTINTYKITFKRIFNLLNTDNISIHFLLDNYKDLLEKIKENTVKVQMNILQVVLLICNLQQNNLTHKTDNKLYNELLSIDKNKINDIYKYLMNIYSKLREKYQTEQETQIMNTKQEENYEDINLLREKHSELYKNIKYIEKLKDISIDLIYEYQKYVILAFYLLKEPTRAEIGDCYFIKTKKDLIKLKNEIIGKNYIDLSNKKLVLNDYKNVATNGKKEFELDKVIIDILKKWKKINPTNYLFIKKDKTLIGHKYMYNVLVNIFQDLLGNNKKISVNILRHSFVSNELKNDVMLNKKKELADKMLHSTGIQEKIYRKKIK